MGSLRESISHFDDFFKPNAKKGGRREGGAFQGESQMSMS